MCTRSTMYYISRGGVMFCFLTWRDFLGFSQITGGQPLTVEVAGVEYMNDDPAMTDVLYAKVHMKDGSDRWVLRAPVFHSSPECQGNTLWSWWVLWQSSGQQSPRWSHPCFLERLRQWCVCSLNQSLVVQLKDVVCFCSSLSAWIMESMLTRG